MATDLALTGKDARELERHTDALIKLQDDTQTFVVKAALKSGEHLTAIHDILSAEGKFTEYVLEKTGISRSTAYNYMAAFKHFGRCKTIELFEDTAMYLLAKDSTPEEAYDRAIALTGKGHKITRTKAQEIVDAVLSESRAMQENDETKGLSASNQLDAKPNPDDYMGGFPAEAYTDIADSPDDPTDISSEHEQRKPAAPASSDVHGLTPQAVDEAVARLNKQERDKAEKPAEPNELGELREHVFGLLDGLIDGKPPHYEVYLKDLLKEWMSR